MNSTFVSKLKSAQSDASEWGVYISPRVETLPFEIQRHDDPFLPYMRAIYAATSDLVCAYVFDLSAYLALAAAGMVALERSIALVRQSHVAILDAVFATNAFSEVWDEAGYNVDAVTIAECAPTEAFHTRSDRQAYVDSEDYRFSARYSRPKGELITTDSMIRLLPLDTLYRARSLAFEDSLRNTVVPYVSV